MEYKYRVEQIYIGLDSRNYRMELSSYGNNVDELVENSVVAMVFVDRTGEEQIMDIVPAWDVSPEVLSTVEEYLKSRFS